MPLTKEELQERSQLVHIHEANCKIEYPSVDEANFRIATMKRLGVIFAMKEVKPLTITGPVTNTPQRPAPARK